MFKDVVIISTLLFFSNNLSKPWNWPVWNNLQPTMLIVSSAIWRVNNTPLCWTTIKDCILLINNTLESIFESNTSFRYRVPQSWNGFKAPLRFLQCIIAKNPFIDFFLLPHFGSVTFDGSGLFFSMAWKMDSTTC